MQCAVQLAQRAAPPRTHVKCPECREPTPVKELSSPGSSSLVSHECSGGRYAAELLKALEGATGGEAAVAVQGSWGTKARGRAGGVCDV